MGIFQDQKIMLGYQRAKEKRMQQKKKAGASSSAGSETEPLAKSTYVSQVILGGALADP